MKFDRAYTLKEIAELATCTFQGDPNHIVLGINEIHRVEEGDIVFVDHPKYYDKALNSAATTIIINKEVDCPEGKALILSEKPFDTFNFITRFFKAFEFQSESVSQAANIHPDAFIYPSVFIGKNVHIAKGAIIYPNAVIMDDTSIGENVIIGPGSIIGHSAFYYKKKETGYDRMHSCGSVIIEKNVEIGANCTIDKGVTASTIIGEGSKLDNMVHIGHDTIVGKHCLMAAQVGIAGCVKIEDHVTLWGQVGCASDVVVGEKAVVLAQSGISKSLEPGQTYFGSPCGEVKEKFKEMAALRSLPAFMKK